MALAAVVSLSACGQQPEERAPQPRPVRTETIERRLPGDAITMTGHVEAQNEAALAFRIGGRMIGLVSPRPKAS